MTRSLPALGAFLVATSAATVLAAGATTAPAHAAGKHFHVVYDQYGAQLEGCKVRSADGSTVTFYARLDNTGNRGDDTRAGSFSVFRGTKELGSRGFSPPVPAGRVSGVKSVSFAPGGTVKVTAGLGVPAQHTGSARTVRLSAVGVC